MSRMAEHHYGDTLAPDTPARIAYRETSRVAWRQSVSSSGSLDHAIMEAIEAAGRDGITCSDIEAQIKRTHQACSGNLRHLVERKLVEPSGQHGLTPSGRKAMKWRVV